MTHFSQSKNNIGDAGACSVGEVLKTNSSLRVLKLVSVLHGFFFCFTCLACIACIARILVFVTRGEQRKISFGNRGACGLGEGLQSNGSLKKLDLVIFFLYLFLCRWCCDNLEAAQQ